VAASRTACLKWFRLQRSQQWVFSQCVSKNLMLSNENIRCDFDDAFEFGVVVMSVNVKKKLRYFYTQGVSKLIYPCMCTNFYSVQTPVASSIVSYSNIEITRGLTSC